jgi:hypothetical protein
MPPGEPSTGHWNTLPRSRFAPLGVEGATPLIWAGRVSVVLLGVAAVYLLVALARPLPAPGAPGGALPEPAPAPGLAPAPVEQREARLASLTDDNPFSRDREAWASAELARGPGEGDGPGDAAGETAGAPEVAERPDDDRGPTSIDGIPITDPEDVEQTLQAAYKNLELRGIVSTAAGSHAAMLSFVQSRERDRSTRFLLGEEFVDDSHPSHPWRVLFIDAERDRVVLRREGRNLVVPLFRTVIVAEPEPAPEAEAELTPEQDMAERRRRTIEDLRAAGVPPREIALILAALDEELARLAEEERAAVAAATEDPRSLEDHRETLEQAGGLESIMKLMESAQQNTRRFRPPGREPEDPEPDPDGGGGG